MYLTFLREIRRYCEYQKILVNTPDEFEEALQGLFDGNTLDRGRGSIEDYEDLIKEICECIEEVEVRPHGIQGP